MKINFKENGAIIEITKLELTALKSMVNISIGSGWCEAAKEFSGIEMSKAGTRIQNGLIDISYKKVD